MVLIRWSAVSQILVILRNNPTLQIQSNILISWLFMMLIIFGSPLEDSFENKMLIFNETMVAMYLYILTTLTDFNDDAELFDNCGIALLSIVIISFSVNFLKFVYYMLRDIYYRIKRACNKAKINVA